MPARVNLTIPVLNEEERLARCLPKLHEFLASQRGFSWQVVVANNGSTDRTQDVAEEFSRQCPNLRTLWLPQQGRGGALKHAWLESDAEVLSYMDVDLSTGLETYPALVEAVSFGGWDLAIGSRMAAGAQTRRSWKRELTSRCYVGLVKALCHVRVSDAQCGFKAISRKAAHALLPLVQDTGWFFDTELLVLAERLGYRIREVPVHWVEDRDSRVRLFETARRDIAGLLRMRRTLSQGVAGDFTATREERLMNANER